jgi:hypothetical protein
VDVPARCCGGRPGTVFLPFHYGDVDRDTTGQGRSRAANELTLTAWDPVSKQPQFKGGAVRVSRLGRTGDPETGAED